MVGKRPLKRILAALGGKQHYVALWNMASSYPRFWENLWRYLTGHGSYPYEPVVRTPRGPIQPVLYSHHDLLTLNEIFCRRDYEAKASLRVVLDLGSNIGLSALFFLTRNTNSRCFLYEPDSRNIAKLKKTLTGYESRYVLHEFAVADRHGEVTFGIEPTGRYGGIDRPTGESIRVPCLHINEILGPLLDECGQIDILKIDTEGLEEATVRAIDPIYLPRIKTVYLEAEPKDQLWREYFLQRQYGSVCQLRRRAAPA